MVLLSFASLPKDGVELEQAFAEQEGRLRGQVSFISGRTEGVSCIDKLVCVPETNSDEQSAPRLSEPCTIHCCLLRVTSCVIPQQTGKQNDFQVLAYV